MQRVDGCMHPEEKIVKNTIRQTCIHCGNLILRKIKIGATRCQILKLICTKFDFHWGAYSAPPDPLSVFKGPTSKGREGESGERKGRERKGDGRGGKGREGMRRKGWGNEERGMGACTHWDFRKSAPMVICSLFLICTVNAIKVHSHQ